MKTIPYILLCLCCLPLRAQRNYVYDTERVRSLQLIVDGDPLLPPVLRMGSRQQLELSFDLMGHEYHRLLYRISHCPWDWGSTDGESLFESDYLAGLNGQPIDDYDTSFNTTQLYTHYRLTLPDKDTRLLLSGNYRIEVFDEDDYGDREATPLLKAEFCVAEAAMSVSAQVSPNTDVDFNASHQQLTYSVSYGSLPVTDPQRELHTIVRQNRRGDNAVVDLKPNIIKPQGIEFTHRRELIFNASNEFHKFETIDMHRPNLNVDNLRWREPFYYFTLFPDQPPRTYTYDQDQNGAFILRNAEYDDEELTSEYAWVTFTLLSPERLSGGEVYVCGLWTNGDWDPLCLMQWDEANSQYTASVYLKQGYYSYQYRQLSADGKTGLTRQTEGDFSEAENEYTVLVYYRKLGDRYDRLVNYSTVNYR
ncbi:MAG: DUF5103 domain-containing protein [Prevotellaceae bacterium]|nr:DUF5103 domain-containing protein [Prevotellaceae bacterium]